MEFTFSEPRVTYFHAKYLQWEFWSSKAEEVAMKMSFLKLKENEKFSSFAILENRMLTSVESVFNKVAI